MHHRYRRLSSLLLAIVWLMGSSTPSIAADQTSAPAGTVSMVVSSLALGVGAEWGRGSLTLPDGVQYHFTVKGLELGSVGAAKAFLHGHVYHLTKVGDFTGLYGAVDIDFPYSEAREKWCCGINMA